MCFVIVGQLVVPSHTMNCWSQTTGRACRLQPFSSLWLFRFVLFLPAVFNTDPLIK